MYIGTFHSGKKSFIGVATVFSRAASGIVMELQNGAFNNLETSVKS